MTTVTLSKEGRLAFLLGQLESENKNRLKWLSRLDDARSGLTDTERQIQFIVEKIAELESAE